MPAMAQPELLLCLVRFVSPGQGYAVLEAEGQDILFGTWDGGEDPGAILRTEDAGRTWQQVGSLRGETVEALSFADRSNGWELGSPWDPRTFTRTATLYRTRDGGPTWEAVR